MITTIISVIAGGAIAYLIARWQMEKNQIDHYFINSYDIGKGLTDDFPDFSLHYGDEVLANNVRVIQGGFINIGRNDIGENGKYTGFKLILPQDCIVKAVKVSLVGSGLKVKSIKKGEPIEVDIIVNENEIGFEIDGLLKSQELFNYTAIVEAPVDTPIMPKMLKFDHRIENTQDIKSLIIGQYYNSPDSKYLRWVSWLTFVLTLGFTIGLFSLKKAQYIQFYHELVGPKESPYMIGFLLILVIIAYFLLFVYSIKTLFGRESRIIKVLNKNFKKEN